MADNDTLLAYLSPWFAPRTEDIAVEALGYILKKSSASREAMDDVVRTGVRNVGPVADIRTHASDRPAAAGLMARASIGARPKEDRVTPKFKW